MPHDSFGKGKCVKQKNINEWDLAAVWPLSCPRLLQPRGLHAAHQAPLPMDFPGGNPAVGCHFLLQMNWIKNVKYTMILLKNYSNLHLRVSHETSFKAWQSTNPCLINWITSMVVLYVFRRSDARSSRKVHSLTSLSQLTGYSEFPSVKILSMALSPSKCSFSSSTGNTNRRLLGETALLSH